MERYNFKVVEKKWQNHWEKNKSFKTLIEKSLLFLSDKASLKLKSQLLTSSLIFVTWLSNKTSLEKNVCFSKLYYQTIVCNNINFL